MDSQNLLGCGLISEILYENVSIFDGQLDFCQNNTGLIVTMNGRWVFKGLLFCHSSQYCSKIRGFLLMK